MLAPGKVSCGGKSKMFNVDLPICLGFSIIMIIVATVIIVIMFAIITIFIIILVMVIIIMQVLRCRPNCRRVGVPQLVGLSNLRKRRSGWHNV